MNDSTIRPLFKEGNLQTIFYYSDVFKIEQRNASVHYYWLNYIFV